MLKIDEKLCIGCGICEDQCPFGSITIVDSIAVVGESCTLCGACVEACEVEAMSIDTGGKAVRDDLDSWSGVWVFCEFVHGQLAPVSTELLGIGRTLADKRGVNAQRHTTRT